MIGTLVEAGTLYASPPNEAVRRIGPVPSDGGTVTVAVAMPFASVVAVAVNEPMVKVTSRPVSGWPPSGSVRSAVSVWVIPFATTVFPV